MVVLGKKEDILEAGDDTDSEIEIKPPKPPTPEKKIRKISVKKTPVEKAPVEKAPVVKKAQPVETTPTPPPTPDTPEKEEERIPYVEIPKTRKKYNITPELREAKRERMLHALAVKKERYLEKVKLREQEKAVQNEYIEKAVVAKAEKIKRKRSKIDKILKNISTEEGFDEEPPVVAAPQRKAVPIITKASIQWL